MATEMADEEKRLWQTAIMSAQILTSIGQHARHSLCASHSPTEAGGVRGSYCAMLPLAMENNDALTFCTSDMSRWQQKWLNGQCWKIGERASRFLPPKLALIWRQIFLRIFCSTVNANVRHSPGLTPELKVVIIDVV